MNANQPAFPQDWFENGDVQPQSIGLTKREYFSAMAMQGILANNMLWENVSELSVNFADDLLSELEKDPKQ
jgi:hypothetical protein